jgi:hypothetical protein
MKLNIDFDITFTNFIGASVIFTGIISLAVIHNIDFTSTCITLGSGLIATAKVANTFYDNARVN